LGTATNDHVDLFSNGLVRGRLSNLDEFFIGTTATALPGDLMNSVGNSTFLWAVNGYTNFNGGATYGLRFNGAAGDWGSAQGEQDNNQSGEAAVAGLYAATAGRGVIGQKNAGGLGWGGLFLEDLGYTGFFGVASDQSVKKNIQPIKNALAKLLKLEGTTFQYTLPFLGGDDVYYGFLAQNVESVFPEMVKEKDFRPMQARALRFNYANPELYKIKAVSTSSLIPVLVEAIKEQQKMIEELKKQNEGMQKKIEALEKK
jgi:hypothetical protein